MKIYAEDVNYWKSAELSGDTWIDKAKAEIKAAGGKVIADAFGSSDGRAAWMLEFSFGDERFRAVWPVLPTRSTSPAAAKAARIQAATMLYHDIKAKAVSAKVHGTRSAFFQFLALPDGRTASEVASPELSNLMPRLLMAPAKERTE